MKALLFPLRGFGGWTFLLIGTILFIVDHSVFMGRRRSPVIYALLLTGLLVASYLYRTLEDAVDGRERPSSAIPPTWGEGWKDLLHYAGGLVVAFLPIPVLVIFALAEQKGRLQRDEFRILLGGLAFLGTLYLPMALLLIGFSQRPGTAFNFGVGFRGIVKMGWDYAICCLYFLASHAVWVFLEICWVLPTRASWDGDRVTAAAGTAFVGLYLSVLQMRQLGLLYRKHHGILGWRLGSDSF